MTSGFILIASIFLLYPSSICLYSASVYLTVAPSGFKLPANACLYSGVCLTADIAVDSSSPDFK